MNKFLVVCSIACFAIGFFWGRGVLEEKETVHYVKGETIRDTVTQLIPDTVYLAGELKYRYVYETDTIYKDVPVIDREGSIAETVRDWNRTREYDRLLFDNEFGKLTIVLSVQYNELQKLSYFFTPMYKEITIIKKRVLYPLFRLLSHI
ncbi:MAG: hypothetical protein KH112_06165 [Sanguibacteroides justesenii]|jgi:hypothetical protein|nr:hypothetical protein [Sanguibacteroides justesenii]